MSPKSKVRSPGSRQARSREGREASDDESKVQSPKSRSTFHVSRFTFHASRITHHAPVPQSLGVGGSRFTLHVSRFTHAFTLLEVMIVVAIMGIVMTMSVPIVYHVWHREPLNQAVRDVQEVLTNARRRAILSDTPSEVIFHPKERRLEVSGGGGGAPGQGPAGLVVNAGLPAVNASGLSAQISDHVSIDLLDINLIEYRDAEAARVRFYPNGTCDEMILVLHSDQNRQIGIELEVTTGLASVLNEEDLQRMAYGRR